MSNKKHMRKVFFYIGLIIFLILLLFPFFIMLMTSFKTSGEAIAYPPSIIPKTFILDHYRDIFNPKIFPFLNYFKNSFIIAGFSAGISVILGILGGYALSKLNFIGKTVINESFHMVYMFSGILLIVPLFKIISSFGLTNTRTSLIICMIVQTMPTSIYMIKSYFDTIPKELEEAGKVDGLSALQCIIKIVVPLSISGIISVFVYAFMISWNDYLFASVFLNSPDLFTLSIGLNSLFNTPDYVWGRMMAASLVTSLPIVIMYGFSEKLIKGGATEGGVKG